MATYTVKSGDKLASIAAAYDTTTGTIRSLNPGVNFHRLRVGEVIYVPDLAPLPPAPTGAYLFSDEFDGGAGTPPDASKWAYDTGYGGWGNNELQTYTAVPTNCFQDGNGNLVIRAIKTSTGFTSARIKTLGKFSRYGGTWEARLKFPLAAGTWPAWWCMGTYSPWPDCGEVDIAEAYGSSPYVETSVHLPDGAGSMQSMTGQKGIRYQDLTVDTNWHVYQMSWDVVAGTFTFSMDGAPYLTVTGSGKVNWCYSGGNPFYCILNLAVGGTGGGTPPSDFTSQDLLVDYVRAW